MLPVPAVRSSFGPYPVAHCAQRLRAATRWAALGLLPALAACSAPDEEWRASFFNGVVQSSAADARGDVLLVGWFRDTLRVGTATLVSAGGDDAFVAKWSPRQRRFVWAGRAGGGGQDRAHAVVATPAGVYVAGAFSSVTFAVGDTALRNFMGDSLTQAFRPLTRYPPGQAVSTDGFVAKLADAGPAACFVWAQAVAGPADEHVTALAAVANRVYLAGEFRSLAVAVGRDTLANPTGTDSLFPSRPGEASLPQASLGVSFLARLTDLGARGRYEWAQQPPASIYCLAAHPSGVYVAGRFGDKTGFGSDTLTDDGFAAAYVAKLADAAHPPRHVWARAIPAATLPRNQAEALPATKESFAGSYVTALAVRGTAVYAVGRVGTVAYEDDGFVAKFHDAGAQAQLVWGRRWEALRMASAVAAAADGTLYVAGLFQGTVQFGPVRLAATDYGHNNLFLARFSGAGRFEWAGRVGSQPAEQPPSLVAAAKPQAVHLAGVRGPFGSFVATWPGASVARPAPSRP